MTVPLEVQSIDLNLTKNRSAHHTDSYDERGLVVRRGQAFSLTLSCKQSLPAGVCVRVLGGRVLVGECVGLLGGGMLGVCVGNVCLWEDSGEGRECVNGMCVEKGGTHTVTSQTALLTASENTSL